MTHHDRIVIIAPGHPAYEGLHRANQVARRLMREHAGEPWVERAKLRQAELQRRLAEQEATADMSPKPSKPEAA